VAFSDSIATLIGRFYGRHTIPYSKKKSLEGSFAFLVSAFIICYFLNVPLKVALLASFVSCIIESLPLKYDNITIPLGTGVFLVLIT
jgi:dolichol kinase